MHFYFNIFYSVVSPKMNDYPDTDDDVDDPNLFKQPILTKRRQISDAVGHAYKRAGHLLINSAVDHDEEAKGREQVNRDGKKYTPIIHRAIYVFFEQREILSNPKYNKNNFRKNNPDFSHNTTKKWKQLPGVINLLRSVTERYGEQPFERHPEIQWMQNGSLIALHSVPLYILKQYCEDPCSVRFVHPVGRIKYSSKKHRKYLCHYFATVYIQN